MTNLLTNAAKYTDPEGKIRIETVADGNEAVVRISDSGIGISTELLPHVFELFGQGDRGLDRAQGGLGIGLSVVKRLISMHGGQVSVRSEGAGRGATFEIRLPLVKDAGGTASYDIKVKAPSMRVMIVDDNSDAAQSLAMLMSLEGHQVETASTGRQTLERLPVFKPDVVLLDIGLPGMDGYEVARQIRAERGLTAIRLIALTGYSQPQDKQRAEAVGFDDHLVKPVGLSDLQHACMRLVEGR